MIDKSNSTVNGPTKVIPPPNSLLQAQAGANLMVGVRMNITPSSATDWLETRGGNRVLNAGRVDVYAAEMRAGRWKFNGQPIQFDEAGLLLNGQHRLHAVIKSGRTIDTVVQWGIPRDSQDTIDDGAKWSAKDLLHIKGEQNTHLLQATLAWLNREAHGALGTTIKMTNTVAMELLEAHPNIRQSCHFVAGLSGRCPLIPSGTAYLHYRFSEVDSEKADEFFRRLASGLGLTETSPIYRLRERLLKHQATKEKLRSADQLAFTIIAWNAFVEGRPLGLLVWRKSGPTAQEYPTIRGLEVPST